MKIGVGQFYERNDEIRMLAQVGRRTVALIGIESGNRLMDGVFVYNVHDISEKEWSEIDNGWGYTRITDKHIIEITNL